MRRKLNCTITSYIYKSKDKWLFFCFFLAMFMFHIALKTNISDDGIHGQYLENQNIFERAYDLYFKVNGKVLPDLCAAIFTYLPSIFWKIINSLMYVILGYLIYYLFLNNKHNKEDSIILAFVVTFFLPLNLVVSAGYVAGSTNYIWTAVMMLVAFVPLYKNIMQEKIKNKHIIWYILAAIYAGNQEQSLAIMLTMYSLLVVFFLKKKTTYLVYIQMFVMCVSMILLFISPGHQQRSVTYHQFVMPNYQMLTFFDKLHLGITSTFAHFLSYYQHIFGVFCLLLCVSVFLRYRGVLARLFAIVPLLWMVLILAKEYLVQVFPKLSEVVNIFCFTPEWGYGLPDYKYIDTGSFTDYRYYLPVIVTIIVVGMIFVDFSLAFENVNQRIIMMLIFMAGICSRIIMAFSPTLYGSSYRTFSFMYLSLMIIIAVLAKQLLDRYNDKKTVILSLIAISAGMGY